MAYLDSTDAQEALEIELAERYPGHHKVRKIIKLSLIAFVALVNLVVIWRVFVSANIPKKIDVIAPNNALCEAYDKYGNELKLQYQNQLTLSYDSGKEGYFGVPEYYFIPEANQVQVVFRYNNSTLKKLAEEYDLEEVPKKGEHVFDVTLLKITDLTPDNASDQEDPNALEKMRYLPDEVITDTTLLYTYYRFVFEGVSIDESAISSVFLDIYYREDLDYDKTPYGSLKLYDHLHEWIPYKLTAADKRALRD